ncbi:Uncharacterised protein [Bordetella pertussis]|nr:Uncharacterised protein [Bordetella pertussis]
MPLSRSNRRSPRLCSACAIRRLTAGCETNSRRATPFIEPVSITARNASICLSLKRTLALRISIESIMECYTPGPTKHKCKNPVIGSIAGLCRRSIRRIR